MYVSHAVTRRAAAGIIHKLDSTGELKGDDLVKLCNSIARVCGQEVWDRLAELQPGFFLSILFILTSKTS